MPGPVSLPCLSCGNPVPAGQHFCGFCGTTIDGSTRVAPPSPQASVPPAPVPPSPASAGGDYPTVNKILAADLTLHDPLVSLVAATTMASHETDPARRASLRAWAIGSAVLLGIGIIIVIIVAASIAHTAHSVQPSHAGPCQGGPETGSAGTPVGNGNYRFNCEFGGTTVVHLGN